MNNKVYYGICFKLLKNISDYANLKQKIGKDIDYLISKNISYILIDSYNNVIKKSKNELSINPYQYFCEVEVGIESGKILYYIHGTNYTDIVQIINDYNILPKLFIENINLKKYKDKLAKIGLRKDRIYLKEKEKIDKIVSHHFDVLHGLDSLYEKYTGAVYFNDNEWSQVTNNSLKKLFETKDNNSYKYMLPLDNGNILRGADIYYFFSSDVNKYTGPNISQINKWANNCKIFLKNCIKALNQFEIKDVYDIRLMLAVIDNIRNLVLLFINIKILSTYSRYNSYVINIGEIGKDKILNTLISFVYEYQTLIKNACFYKVTNNLTLNTKTMCTEIYQMIDNIIDKVVILNDQYLINKCFNPLREIDNYFENYIVLKYVSKTLPNSKISLIGILYGGLELPFILNQIINMKGNISLIYQNKGMYLDRQASSKTDIQFNMVNIGNYNYSKTINYLLDDNVMSGLTTQHIINELSKINCEITGQITIRHPNINRLPQIKYFDCALDLNLVDKFYLGMLTNTPYSKIKDGTNYDNMFVNELNIFSIMTEVFLKALYINNSFIKNSEVDIFKGYSTGRASMEIVQYNNKFYKEIIEKNGYLPTKNIHKNILSLTEEELQERWLCGLNLTEFIQQLNNNYPTIVTMGIGINNTPHIGTLSQILRCIKLQKAGLKVQIVLGDLDVYNARATNIDKIKKLTNKYKNFILSLGFDLNKGIIRSQYESDYVTKAAFLIAPYIDDKEFSELEENIYNLYQQQNKYNGMTFSVKSSILLMIADFLYLGMFEGYKNILVLSGIDEHMYTKKAVEISNKMNLNINISGLFSKIIRAINDYPKMSKSLKCSSIDLNINKESLKSFILNNKDNNYIYEIMLNSTNDSIQQLMEIKEHSKKNDKHWEDFKVQYIEDFWDICKKWRLK